MRNDVMKFLIDKYDGLVVESFGVGGLPEYSDFYEQIKRAIDLGKLVVMTTQVPSEGSNLGIYRVGTQLKNNLNILTFIFVFAVQGATDNSHHDGKHAGIVIGLALALVHFIGINLTGTSVNPARSFAPALIECFDGKNDSIEQIWIFLIGPFAGGALSGLVYGSLSE